MVNPSPHREDQECVRITRILKKMNITLEETKSMADHYLLSLRGIGETSLIRIRQMTS